MNEILTWTYTDLGCMNPAFFQSVLAIARRPVSRPLQYDTIHPFLLSMYPHVTGMPSYAL